MQNRIGLAVILVSLALGMSACGGGGSKTEVTQQSQSLGQELLDLKNAYDAGAMSEEEYKDAKAKIMKKHD